MKLYLGLICLVLTLLYTLINLKYQVIEKFGEKHPIILIIPIRDREKHLKELLNNLVQTDNLLSLQIVCQVFSIFQERLD